MERGLQDYGFEYDEGVYDGVGIPDLRACSALLDC